MTAPATRLFAGAEPRTENTLSEAERGQLVESCLNLCRKVARQAAARSPGEDIDDLEGEAMLACVEAAKRWHPPEDGKPGAKFSTFAQAYMQKRLNGLVADRRQELAAMRGANWDLIADRGEDFADDSVAYAPNENERELLSKITEPAREAVRLVVFEGLPPDRVADQLGMSVKDVKLILRNAGKALTKAKLKLAEPALF